MKSISIYAFSILIFVFSFFSIAVPQTISFSGTEHLGIPTDSSIVINIVPDQDINVYYQYSTILGGPYTDTPTLLATAGEPHEITIDGLQPDTRYYYRMVYQIPGNSWVTRTEYKFYTQRAKGSTFVFTITSDSHINVAGLGNVTEYRQALARIANDEPDIHLDLGDTFEMDYVNSASVADANYLYQRASNMMGLISHSSPIFLAMGNHENEEGWNFDDTYPQPIYGMNARKRYFPLPIPGRFYTGNEDVSETRVSGDHLREDYYAFTWGDALFVVFDPFQYTMDNPYGAFAGRRKRRSCNG